MGSCEKLFGRGGLGSLHLIFGPSSDLDLRWHALGRRGGESFCSFLIQWPDSLCNLSDDLLEFGISRIEMTRDVNLQCFDDLGERWYEADDDPIALLRAESRLFVPYLTEELSPSEEKLDVLDLGCGAGFISNSLAMAGHRVSGIDISEKALDVARRHDKTRKIEYLKMDACELHYPNETFDAVLAMDLLEHVENPEVLIHEAARVLKKGGRFFFHTFNRTCLTYWMLIQG